MGLAKAEWQTLHGAGGGYTLTAGRSGNINNVELNWGDKQAPPLTVARMEGKGLLPKDARSVRTYEVGDNVYSTMVDVYLSAWLAGRFPGEDYVWVGEQPGTCSVWYDIVPSGFSNPGAVAQITASTGVLQP